MWQVSTEQCFVLSKATKTIRNDDADDVDFDDVDFDDVADDDVLVAVDRQRCLCIDDDGVAIPNLLHLLEPSVELISTHFTYQVVLWIFPHSPYRTAPFFFFSEIIM